MFGYAYPIVTLGELRFGDMFYLLNLKTRTATLAPYVRLKRNSGIRVECCLYPDTNEVGWLHSQTLVINLNKNIAYEECIKQSCDKGAQVKDESQED